METAKLLSWPQLYHGRRGSSPGAMPETTALAAGVLDAQWVDYVPTTKGSATAAADQPFLDVPDQMCRRPARARTSTLKIVVLSGWE